MTREEKQLLLKDLCARLPFGVKVLEDIDGQFDGGAINVLKSYLGNYLFVTKGSLAPLSVKEIKPYLRPISSMTKEEKEELRDTYSFLYSDYPFDDEYEDEDEDGIEGHYEPSTETYDWYNRKMFDYRGLILKGLALEAPDEMYK